MTAWIWVTINFRYLVGYALEYHYAAGSMAWCAVLVMLMTMLAGYAAGPSGDPASDRRRHQGRVGGEPLLRAGIGMLESWMRRNLPRADSGTFPASPSPPPARSARAGRSGARTCGAR